MDVVRASLEAALPLRVGPYLVSIALDEAMETEEGLVLPIRFVRFDGDDVMGMTEQPVALIGREDLGASEARVRAYLEGWLAALPMLIGRAEGSYGEFFPPAACMCPPALGDTRAQTAAEFATLIASDEGLRRAWQVMWDEVDAAVDEETYADFLAEVEPLGAEAVAARRAQALAAVRAEFSLVREHVRAHFGLELPSAVVPFVALHRSLSEAEHAAWEALGLPRPVGVLDLFGPGALAQPTRDGLDIRLHWRFRRDPPELLTALTGGTDGEHFGFFYDDPAKLPAGVAHNFARDSAEMWWSGPTLMHVVRGRLDDIESESLTPDFHADVTRAACQLRLLREAIAAFADAEAEAWTVDASRQGMSFADRLAIPAIVSGVGVVVPGQSFPHVAALGPGDEHGLADGPTTRAWVAAAFAALDQGDPSFALALGRDLHWADEASLQADALALLTRAYRMLGRDALAAIVELHHAGRDLPRVGVL